MTGYKQKQFAGGGEIAPGKHAVCRQLALEVSVIEMADRVMSGVVSPQVSEFYQQQLADSGLALKELA